MMIPTLLLATVAIGNVNCFREHHQTAKYNAQAQKENMRQTVWSDVLDLLATLLTLTCRLLFGLWTLAVDIIGTSFDWAYVILRLVLTIVLTTLILSVTAVILYRCTRLLLRRFFSLKHNVNDK